MQKIVIDTNVMVSALIQPGFPYRIISDLFIDEKIQLCISDELLSEYYEVLSREKFSKFQNFIVRAESLLVEIESKAIKYYPTLELNLISDVDDNMILELAEECLADFIITGNTKDFTFSEYKKTKIVTPRQYWESYKPE